MTDPTALHAHLLAEIEALEPFAFLAIGPAGSPLHAVEVTRREDARLEVRAEPGTFRVELDLPVLADPPEAAAAVRGTTGPST